MKKLFTLILIISLCFTLAACGKTVETAKSSELKNQYPFYETSVMRIINATKVTAEQADEIFIVLVECGLNQDIAYVIGSDESGYTVDFGKIGEGVTNLSVMLNDGKVEKVSNGQTVLYPQSAIDEQKEKEESDKAVAKNAAVVIDSQAYQLVLDSEKVVKLLQDGIDLISSGAGNTVDLYDLAKTAKEKQSELYSSLTKLRDKNSGKYIDACHSYVVNGKSFSEKLMKYLDKEEIKYLSEARECLTASETYILNIISERTAYLKSQGLSDDEITEIITSQPSE